MAKSTRYCFKNARYLHSMLKQWIVGNIWILGDRIVYAGDRMPPLLEGTEVVDCTNKIIVPGYIEPHVHPFHYIIHNLLLILWTARNYNFYF